MKKEIDHKNIKIIVFTALFSIFMIYVYKNVVTYTKERISSESQKISEDIQDLDQKYKIKVQKENQKIRKNLKKEKDDIMEFQEYFSACMNIYGIEKNPISSGNDSGYRVSVLGTGNVDSIKNINHVINKMKLDKKLVKAEISQLEKESASLSVENKNLSDDNLGHMKNSLEKDNINNEKKVGKNIKKYRIQLDFFTNN